MKLFEHSKDEIVEIFADYVYKNNIDTSNSLDIELIKDGTTTSIGCIHFEKFTRDILEDIIETIDVSIVYLPKTIDTPLTKTIHHHFRIEYYPIVISYPRKTFGVWQKGKNIQHFNKNEKLYHYSSLPYKVFNNSYGSILYLKIIFKR